MTADPRTEAVAQWLAASRGDRWRDSTMRQVWRTEAADLLRDIDDADPLRSAAPSPAGRLGEVGPPRVYTVKVAPGLDLSEEALETVRLIRWDREEVEALMTRALSELLDRKPESTTYGMARAVFDALASQGRDHD